MQIKAYKSVPNSVLDEVHYTKSGKEYTIRCEEELTLDMDYIENDVSTKNSQGWDRKSYKFFNRLLDQHPEIFSRINTVRIKNNENPIIDKIFVAHFPAYKDYIGDSMIHHHIGGDGQAAALPSEIHRGSGAIHNFEKESGITEQCKIFSKSCAEFLKAHPQNSILTAGELSLLIKNNSPATNTQSHNSLSNTSSSVGNTDVSKDKFDFTVAENLCEVLGTTLNKISEYNEKLNSIFNDLKEHFRDEKYDDYYSEFKRATDAIKDINDQIVDIRKRIYEYSQEMKSLF